MSDLNSLIVNLYQKHLLSIAVEKQDETLKYRFEEYIKGKYLKFFVRIDDDECKKKMLNDWYETEERHWGNLSSDAKYAKFTEDVALVEIDRLSSMIFGIAEEKYRGNIETYADIATLYCYIDEMRELAEQTFEVNRFTAQKLISEAMVEIEYISDKTTNLSMRLGNAAKYIHN